LILLYQKRGEEDEAIGACVSAVVSVLICVAGSVFMSICVAYVCVCVHLLRAHVCLCLLGTRATGQP